MLGGEKAKNLLNGEAEEVAAAGIRLNNLIRLTARILQVPAFEIYAGRNPCFRYCGCKHESWQEENGQNVWSNLKFPRSFR